MKLEEYNSKFRKAALNSGYSEENIARCLKYAKPIIQNGLPVIYNTTHLSALVGYKKIYIKKAVFFTKSFYTTYEIKKRNGKTRTISEPLPSLKEIQLWILQNILQLINVSPYAKAYKKKTSIKENVRFHINQEKVLAIDIKDFFPSVTLKSIENIFLSFGYSRIISNLLAKLCSKEGYLPQGAPTSPYLSNLFFLKSDEKIFQYCKTHSIKYSRYSDDLTFSGSFDEQELLNVVKSILSELGLKVNPQKTKLMTPNQRQTVTGIVVNKKPQVVFHKRNKIRQDLYYIKKFGLENHIEHEKIKQNNYLEHLLGKVNFILHINPNDKEFRDYKNYLVQLKRNR